VYLCVDFSPWLYEDYEDVKTALMRQVLDACRRPGADSAIWPRSRPPSAWAAAPGSASTPPGCSSRRWPPSRRCARSPTASRHWRVNSPSPNARLRPPQPRPRATHHSPLPRRAPTSPDSCFTADDNPTQLCSEADAVNQGHLQTRHASPGTRLRQPGRATSCATSGHHAGTTYDEGRSP
jgi:hypothetical protein